VPVRQHMTTRTTLHGTEGRLLLRARWGHDLSQPGVDVAQRDLIVADRGDSPSTPVTAAWDLPGLLLHSPGVRDPPATRSSPS